jgi:predicted Fe-Mo cluster-binding NifX family protein
MKRVAIPILNEQLGENFGECNHYEIYEIDKKITGKKTALLPVGLVLTELPEWLKKEGVTDVITYRVNREIINLFASKKVNLFVGIPIKSPDKLIDDYLKGKLESDKFIIAELTKV